jgi:CheY-like chemotaxis protein
VTISARNIRIDSPPAIPLEPGRYVTISIRDHGIGIPKSQLDKIFDPYFTTKQKGSGIGLTVAYSIVNKHNGYISAESSPDGTTFHLYLPATEASASGRKGAPGKLSQGAGRILLMDDEKGIREVGSEMLKALGYEVVCARDGAEALRLYRQARDAASGFDVVILDLTIPGGMGGKETVAKILAIDDAAAVIVSSGYSNDPVMAQFHQYGFRGAVSKPYQLQELGSAVKAVLADRPSA